jgi:hypothetical protein
MIHHVPKSFLRTIVEIWGGDQHIAQAWRLEGSDVAIFSGHEKTAEH